MVKNSMPAIHFLADLSYSSAFMNGEKYHFYPTGLEMLGLGIDAGNGQACADKGGVRNLAGR
jgi:hypothetical protein